MGMLMRRGRSRNRDLEEKSSYQIGNFVLTPAPWHNKPWESFKAAQLSDQSGLRPSCLSSPPPSLPSKSSQSGQGKESHRRLKIRRCDGFVLATLSTLIISSNLRW